MADEKCQTEFDLKNVSLTLGDIFNEDMFNATASWHKNPILESNYICYFQCLATELGIVSTLNKSKKNFFFESEIDEYEDFN